MDALPEVQLLRPKSVTEVLAARAAHPKASFSAAAPISSSTSGAASSRRRC